MTAPPWSTRLDAILREATERYTASNPLSAQALAQAARWMPGGNTRSVLFYTPFPLVMTRGEGARLWDIDGNRYIDFLGEYSAGIFGHSNPQIAAAIRAAVDKGLSLAGPNDLEATLAEMIVKRFPAMDRVRFTNSGTEANLMALALALAATGRRELMVFNGGYHGGLLAFPDGMSAMTVPHRYRYGTYNDVERTRDQILSSGEALSAVLVEPMAGAAGCVPGSPDFLSMLREATRQVGALLIFDEVQTSRLSIGGRQKILGIEPDLTALGKYMGGGSSFGAFGGRADIMDLLDPRAPTALQHAGTFNNNVMTMAAGIAGLRIFDARQAGALNQKGDRLRDALNGLCRDTLVPFQFTGLGSLMNFHPTNMPIDRVSDLTGLDQRYRDLLFFHMAERGIYLARRGFLSLSLEVGDDDVADLIRAFEEFLGIFA